MKRDYERLPIEKFGRHLILSGDLDPVYIALRRCMEGDEQQLRRWLIAYWCFYHCGVASYMSEHKGNEFWREMMMAARNELPSPLGERWPRGHERRHARGAQGINMVQSLRSRFGDEPENMVLNLERDATGGAIFADIAKLVRLYPLFGPWIAFKVCDMLERVLGCPINFDEAAVFMFKDPVKSALMLWRLRTNQPENARPRDQQYVIHEVVNYLREEFRDFGAPPLNDRRIELQEIETVLCKWKSHMNGHYPLNNDIHEIQSGLTGWGETARRFSHFMPEPMEKVL